MTEEKFRDKIPSIIAVAAATVTATVLGSLLGTAGTLAGMGIGSIVSGTLAHLIQRGILRSHKAAKARLEKLKFARRKGLITEDEYTRLSIPVVAAARWKKPDFNWKAIASVTAAALVASFAVVTAAEAIARKPLSDVVTGHHGSGFSVDPGGSENDPQPSSTPSMTSTPSPSVTPSTLPSTLPASTPAPSTSASTSSAPPSQPAPTSQPVTTPAPQPSSSQPGSPGTGTVPSSP